MKVLVYDLQAGENDPPSYEMWAIDAREAIKNGNGRFSYEPKQAKAPRKRTEKSPAAEIKYDLVAQEGGAWTLTADGEPLESDLDEATALKRLEELQAAA